MVPDDRETERVTAWLARVTGRDGPFALTPIRGGASPRRFYRVELDRSAIVMLVPPDTPDVAFARERGRPWPFLEIQHLLASAGVRVPAILAADCDAGLLLVEDLGQTLAEHLERRPHEREALYRSAVHALARAQAALAPLPADSVIRLRQFDATLYTTELEHFWDWAIAARAVNAPRAPFQRALDFLVAKLTALPRGFTHRDYQSRNLLVPTRHVISAGELALGWIDFQDALLGPRAYDLVALLCDSYQPFERAFVERRLDDYAQACALSSSERHALGQEFDLLTVQRKLKDAGRFVFIERRRSDPSFLPFVAPTLDIVTSALDRLSDIPALRDLATIVAAARRACE